LARLLGSDSVTTAPVEQVQNLVDNGFDHVVDGLLAEASASDDVFDRESARGFVDARLDFLGTLLSPAQRSRLREALRAKIEAW
jgi:hypothetical protein